MRLAIIPARGGSKRIPGKNIKNFFGKPIIAHAIEKALQSDLFDEVMVSTDHEETASIARTYGAMVPFLRSVKNSDDHATTADVINEVLTAYQQKGRSFEYTCCIYATSPLMKIPDLKNGFDLLISGTFDSVFSAVSFQYPIWRALKIENDRARMIWPEHLNSRSQDVEPAYHDAGQWYWLRISSFLEQCSLFMQKSGIIELDPSGVQDIDDISDWKIAELKYELQNSKLPNLF